MQQSVCAIELIGIKLFGAGVSIEALRTVRDKMLASTAAGREWIALFERVQFALLPALMRDAKLLATAGELIQGITATVNETDAVFEAADARRASALLRKLRSSVKVAGAQRDLDAVIRRIDQLAGRSIQQSIESLMRQKPSGATRKPAASKPAPRGKRRR